MAYIDRDILVKEIEKLTPGYDGIGTLFLMRTQVLKVILAQPVIEMQKCCATCVAWDRDSNKNDRCFCEYIEARTTADFSCGCWEEDKNNGCKPQV